MISNFNKYIIIFKKYAKYLTKTCIHCESTVTLSIHSDAQIVGTLVSPS